MPCGSNGAIYTTENKNRDDNSMNRPISSDNAHVPQVQGAPSGQAHADKDGYIAITLEEGETF